MSMCVLKRGDLRDVSKGGKFARQRNKMAANLVLFRTGTGSSTQTQN